MRGLRLLIFALAVGAGLAAVAVVRSEMERLRSAAPVPVAAPAPEEIPKTDVLVLARDVRFGERLTSEDVVWRPWPAADVPPSFLTRDRTPDAVETLSEAIVRSFMVEGAPLTEDVLLRMDQPGVLSAELRTGLRAFAVEITPETAAGGFILPGSYVDVISTRNVEFGRDADTSIANTLLRAVRVLAIDQSIAESTDDVSEIGSTATLEVTPSQAEILALAMFVGDVTLTLRDLSDQISEDGSEKIHPEPEIVFDLRSLSSGLGGSYEQQIDAITMIRGNRRSQMVLE